MKHSETQTGYGVLVTRKDGKVYLWNREPMPKEPARIIADDLSKNQFTESTKIVRIKATWEVEE